MDPIAELGTWVGMTLWALFLITVLSDRGRWHFKFFVSAALLGLLGGALTLSGHYLIGMLVSFCSLGLVIASRIVSQRWLKGRDS